MVRWIRMEQGGFALRLVHGLLYLLSLPYQFGVMLRNRAFDYGWLSQYQAPVPAVVSVGNIVAGGTGKTPLTALLATTLSEELEIAVSSRGYRSPAEKLPSPLVLSRGEGPMHPAHYCGDEPYLIAKNVPKAHLFVGRNRKLAANLAAKAGASLLLLDDGMQHRQLARDFNIVLVDARNPFGYSHFLPRGTLRESPEALSRADLVVVNHLQDAESYRELEFNLSGYTTAPVVGARLEAVGIFDLSGAPQDAIKGKKVAIFCGIAHPESFETTVESLGAEIVMRKFTPDHITLTESELQDYSRQASEAGASFLLCTEKDQVKLPVETSSELPVLWVKSEMRIVEGRENWEHFIAKVKAFALRGKK